MQNSKNIFFFLADAIEKNSEKTKIAWPEKVNNRKLQRS